MHGRVGSPRPGGGGGGGGGRVGCARTVLLRNGGLLCERCGRAVVVVSAAAAEVVVVMVGASGGQPPHAHGAVVGRGGEEVGVGVVPRDGVDGARVTGQHVQQLARAHMPDVHLPR